MPNPPAFSWWLFSCHCVNNSLHFKERASLNKIFVVRDKDPAHHPVKVDLNAEVGPGDIITVEESFF